MKTIIPICTLIFLISCNENTANRAGVFADSSSRASGSLYSKLADSSFARDITITPQNSYSDLFIDSSKVDQFIGNEKMTSEEERAFRNFYIRRNYQFAWMNSDGLTEQGRGFWNLYTYNDDSTGDKVSKQLRLRMDTLTEKDSFDLQPGDSSIIQTELALTFEFVKYLKDNRDVLSSSSRLDQYLPVRKTDALLWAEHVLNSNDSLNGPVHPVYRQLKEHLRRYYEAAKQETPQAIDSLATIPKKGSNAPTITQLRKRLQLHGEVVKTDTSAIFNDSLEIAIRNYQTRHGMLASGTISDSLVKSLNEPIEKRIEQILVNMNRLLWTPLPDSNQITVNIPSYKLVVTESGNKAFEMDVIVGREGWNTMMFNGDLNQIVFSPYWNVPPSIVREEIMPAMKANKNYLKSRNMEVVKQSDSIPVIRQLPGKGNALGKVKFLFPNSYDIYLHDTESKDLFTRTNKAISHGCIRVADAEKLATYLLRNDASWTPEKIRAAMNSGKEQFVRVKQPVPVALTYFTTWVDSNGQLVFYNDIYGNDAKTARMMFTTNRWI